MLDFLLFFNTRMIITHKYQQVSSNAATKMKTYKKQPMTNKSNFL